VGRVEYVYDTLDPATRTGTARVAVPNPGRRIKPGMYATATLFGAPSEARPTVPSEAVIRTGDEAVVILALGEGRFRPQPVTLGEEGEGAVQILAGLDGGETVVTSAQFLIDSEARLAASIGAMVGAMPDAAPDPTGEVDHSQMNH
jgi:multidrug efflux pump subunit AcrA (membrane-fusion protein)